MKLLFFTCVFLLAFSKVTFSDEVSTWIEFAHKHRTTLSQGEIEIIPHNNGDLGGTGIALFDEPISAVWQVITDYPEYSKFMPRNLHSEVLRHQQNTVFFKTRYESAFPFEAVENESRIVHETHNPNVLKMTWVAEKTNLEFNRGFWLLIKDQDFSPAVLVVYQTRFSIAWVPSTLAVGPSQKTLKATMQAARKRTQAHLPRYQPLGIRFAWENTNKNLVPSPH